MRFLVFRLYGPLASWGEVAVGEVRPSELRPTRSALLGLLAAALGLRREDPRQEELAEGLLFAVRVDGTGVPLVDYHTVQVTPPRRGRTFATRVDELLAPRHELATLVSRRSYRADAAYTTVAWQSEPARATFPLTELAKALERPAFSLYLGRKSCVLGHPLVPQLVEVETILEALETADAALAERRSSEPTFGAWPPSGSSAKRTSLFWEGEEAVAGVPAAHVETRRDDPVSRTGWRFRVRREYSAPLPREAEDVSESDHAET